MEQEGLLQAGGGRGTDQRAGVLVARALLHPVRTSPQCGGRQTPGEGRLHIRRLLGFVG